MLVFKANLNNHYVIFGDIYGNINFVNVSSPVQATNVVSTASSAVKGLCLIKNNSGEETIIAVSEDGEIANMKIDGEIIWNRKELISNPYPPVSGDLDRDGQYEIVIADSSGNIFKYDADGNILSGFPIKEDYPFVSPPSLGDIDCDGYGEIIIRSSRYLHAYNYNGTQLNNFPVVIEWEDFLIEKTSQPIIGDISGDNLPEIITGTQNGLITAFDVQGKIADGFPVTIGNNVKSSPIIADLDGDGDIDIVAVSDDYYIYVWDFPDEYNQENIFWGGYLGGITHSAQMKNIEIQTPQPSEELLVQELVYNYPNPTEGNFTTIHYFVNYPADIYIKIYDLSGEVIDEIRTVGQPLIDNEVIWNLDGIESGVYNARLEAVGNGKREYKFFKIAVIK